MSETENPGARKNPVSGLSKAPVLAGLAVFLLVWWLDGKPGTGLLAGLVAVIAARMLVARKAAKDALLRAESLLGEGNVANAQPLLDYAQPRLSGDKKLTQKYVQLREAASAYQQSASGAAADVAHEPAPIVTDETPAPVDLPLPRLVSWRSVVLLCLVPFIFIPDFRQIYPHLRNAFSYIGLWFATLVALFALLALRQGISPWEKRLAPVGLALAFAAFLVSWVAGRSTLIPGVMPGFNMPSQKIPWPVTAVELLVLVVSIILHECAHGLAAYLAGDRTAKNAGRISLNPLRHIDLFGSIILPAIMAITPGGIIFGWTKPVPVTPDNFRSPRRGRLAVSLAGVGTNLFIAVLCSSLLITLGILLHLRYPAMTSRGFAFPWGDVVLTGLPAPMFWKLVVTALKAGIVLNLILFTLNILPVPPLDGYGVIEGLMPAKVRTLMFKVRPIGSVLFLALIMFKVIDSLLWPGMLVAFYLNMIAGALAKLG